MASAGLGLITIVLLWSVAPSRTVAIRTFKFRPDTVVVSAGDSVAWTNEDDVEHTVTADSGASMRFDHALAKKGDTYRARFTRPGVYPYHCERHTFMRGVVRVTPTGELP